MLRSRVIALRSELKDALAQRDVYHEHLIRAEARLERQRNGAGSPAISRAPIPSPSMAESSNASLARRRVRPPLAPMGPRQSRSSRSASTPDAFRSLSLSPRVATQDPDGMSTRSGSPRPDIAPTPTSSTPPPPAHQAIPTDVRPEDAFDDAGIVIEGLSDLTPSPQPSSTPTTGSSSPVAPFQRATSLTPPPSVSFESQPVKWKGLPLEAALCEWPSNVAGRCLTGFRDPRLGRVAGDRLARHTLIGTRVVHSHSPRAPHRSHPP